MNPNGFQSIYNDPNLASAKATAQTANQNALSSEVAGMQLPDMLRQALTAKFTDNNPLIADMGRAREDVMNSFTGAPLSVLPENNNGMIFSPTQQADLIQRQRSAPIARLSTLNDLFGLNVGGIQNVIDSTGRAFGAQTRATQGQAELAQNNVAQLLQELQLKASELAQWRSEQLQLQQLRQEQEKERRQEEMEKTKLAEQIRQFNEQLAFEKTKPSNTSSGIDPIIASLLLGNGGGKTSTSAPAVDYSKYVTDTKPAARSNQQENLLKGMNLNLTSAWGSTPSTPVSQPKQSQPSNSSYVKPLDWSQIFK